MNSKQNFFKYITIIVVLAIVASILNNDAILNIRKITQTNLSQGLRTIKITEERSKIDDKKISISINMPEIHYSNTEVERYINTYIRSNINDYVNHQRQIRDLQKDGSKKYININYHIAFEDKSLLNVVIYRNKSWDKNNFELEKDSYIFDLKTGQRVYLDNFLKNNEDYSETISNYINNYIDRNKLKVDKDIININKQTNYIIVADGIDVYFNPYKKSSENICYEFKIPNEIFKNKIKMVVTNNIVANVDTQTITKNNDYINCVINIPIIMMSNKEIEKSINDEIRNEIMKFYNEAQSQAKEYQKDLPDVQNKFVANVDFEVKKNSDNMLSLVIEYYKYSGGAHGYYENISHNIDVRNGRELSLKDLFKDNYDYKKVINKEIREQIEDIIKKEPQYNGVYEFNGIKEEQKFYIQDDNIVIYFDLYDIAPYAAGIPEFQINIKTIDHMLKDEYIDVFK
ncbi:MAG: DUF3298 and DUF4163 domain-containing protein [Peptostreptococcaceae bacterium]